MTKVRDINSHDRRYHATFTKALLYNNTELHCWNTSHTSYYCIDCNKALRLIRDGSLYTVGGAVYYRECVYKKYFDLIEV